MRTCVYNRDGSLVVYTFRTHTADQIVELKEKGILNKVSMDGLRDDDSFNDDGIDFYCNILIVMTTFHTIDFSHFDPHHLIYYKN